MVSQCRNTLALVLLVATASAVFVNDTEFLNATSPRTISAKTTFFGAKDNCPPGGDIAWPRKGHGAAGGVGTYDNPITFAGTAAALPKHTIIYVPRFQKYFIMEDECQECARGWKKHKQWHFDLWMGPDIATPGTYLIDCENKLTGENKVLINPASNLQVNTKALFDSSNGCIEQVSQHCKDHGNKCGNLCQVPSKDTCEELAKLFALSLARFKELNPHMSCNDQSSLGRGMRTVCMGGSCGD